MTKQKRNSGRFTSKRMKGNTNGFKKGEKPWNYGLTKDTDIRVKKIGNRNKRTIETKNKISKYQKGRPKMKLRSIKNGGGGKNWTCGLTKKNSEKFRMRCEKAKETIDNMSIEKLKDWHNKIKETLTGRIRTEKERESLRKGTIKRIERQKLDGMLLIPSIGHQETKIINHFEKVLGFKFLRQHQVAGFYLDGYSPELNLAIEVDEKFHQKQKEKEKDSKREQLIKNELHCSFLRIPTHGGKYYGIT